MPYTPVLSYPDKENTLLPFSEDMTKRIQLLQKLAFSKSNPGADAIMAERILTDLGQTFGQDFLSEEKRDDRRNLPSIPEKEKDDIRMELQILASRDTDPSLHEMWNAFDAAFTAHNTHRLKAGEFHSKALRIAGENAGAFTDGLLGDMPLYGILKDALDIDADDELDDEKIDLLMEKADALTGVITDAVSGEFSLDDIKELLGVSVLSKDMFNEMSFQLTQIKGALTQLKSPVKKAGEHGDQWKRDLAKKISKGFGKITAIAGKTALSVAVPETNVGKIVTFVADAITSDKEGKSYADKRLYAARADANHAEALIDNWAADTGISALNAVTEKERHLRRKAKYEQARAVLEKQSDKTNPAVFSVAEEGLLRALKMQNIASVEDLGEPENISGKLQAVPYFSFVRDADGNLARMDRDGVTGKLFFRSPLMTTEQCDAAVAEMRPVPVAPTQQTAEEANEAEESDGVKHLRGIHETIVNTGLEHTFGAVADAIGTSVAKKVGAGMTSILSLETLSNLSAIHDRKKALGTLSKSELALLETRKTFSKIAKESQVRALFDKIRRNTPLSEKEQGLRKDLQGLGIYYADDLKDSEALDAVHVMESPNFEIHRQDGTPQNGTIVPVMSAKETQIRALLFKTQRSLALTAQEDELRKKLASECGIKNPSDLTDTTFFSQRKRLSLACEKIPDTLFVRDAHGVPVTVDVPAGFDATTERDSALNAFKKEAASVLNKPEGVKAYEDQRLIISLERIGKRALTVAEKSVKDMQIKKMATRDLREKEARDVLDKLNGSLQAPLHPWEKVLAAKLKYADITDTRDMKKGGDGYADVNRDFIRRGMPDLKAKPVVEGGFEQLTADMLTPCERQLYAQMFENAPATPQMSRSLPARPEPKPVRKTVRKKINIKKTKTLSSTGKDDGKPESTETKADESTLKPEENILKPEENILPPDTDILPVKDPLVEEAKHLFMLAEVGEDFPESDKVFLGAMLTAGIHTAEDLETPDAAEHLKHGLSHAFKEPLPELTTENKNDLSYADLTPAASNTLMSYLSNRSNMPNLREAQAKGVLKKVAENQPLEEWEYCLSVTLNLLGAHQASDLNLPFVKTAVRAGIADPVFGTEPLTRGGFDRFSIEKLPTAVQNIIAVHQEPVKVARLTQATTVLTKMAAHEKLNDNETVLAALLGANGIGNVEQLNDKDVTERIRSGFQNSFVKVGLNRDFSALRLEDMSPDAAHKTMMFMEAMQQNDKAKEPVSAAQKMQIINQFSEAMARVDVYEKTIELPREFAKKKQISLQRSTLAR